MTLSEHLYGFADVEDMFGDTAELAALLRASGVAQLGGASVERQLQPLRAFLESNYQRVADDWVLAKLSECPAGEAVLFRSWECRVEADDDGSRHLRCDGLRFADVTGETEVARRKAR